MLGYFWLSLLLIRHHSLDAISPSYSSYIWEHQIYLGWLQDLGIAMLPWMLAGTVSLASTRAARGTYIASSLGIWIAFQAYTLYYQFFHVPLHLDVVFQHGQELPLVFDVGLAYASKFTITSGIALIASWVAYSSSRPQYHQYISSLGLVIYSVIILTPLLWPFVIFAITTCFLFQRFFQLRPLRAVWVGAILVLPHWSPIWVASPHILNDAVHQVWWNDFQSDEFWEEATININQPPEAYLSQLTRLRDEIDPGYNAYEKPFGVTDLEYQPLLESWPLFTKLHYPDNAPEKLRNTFGLPNDKPIHVITLFVESMRHFEWGSLEHRKAIYPELSDLTSKHGVVFLQTYSSGLLGNAQTVRGQFAALCSAYPRFRGGFMYSRTNYPIRCLPQLLQEQGYTTLFSEGTHSDLHDSGEFSLNHGIEHVYDVEHFSKQGVQPLGNGFWGLWDGHRLELLAEMILERATQGKKIYGTVVTVNSHPPHQWMEAGELPEDWVTKTASHPEYQGFLSQMRYQDKAAASFIRKILESPIGDQTLIVVMGDHSTPVTPMQAMTEEQLLEVRSRVFLSFITKNLQAPREIHYPVHQIDVAPSIAHILGLNGNVTWIGRSVFSGKGSPWIFPVRQQIQYRTATQSCMNLQGSYQCIKLGPGDDLLYQAKWPTTHENSEQTKHFQTFYTNSSKIYQSKPFMFSGAK